MSRVRIAFRSWRFRSDVDLRIGVTSQAAISSIIRREQLEIIHTHTEFGVGLAARLAARRLKIPHIHTAHTLYEQYRHYLLIGKMLPIGVIRCGLRYFSTGVMP